MTWTLIFGLAVVIWLQKAVGPILAGRWRPSPRVHVALHLLAVPVLAGLVVVQTVGDGSGVVIDARLPAVVAAGVATWRGAPFIVVVLLAAAVAAGIRLVA